MVFQKFHSVCGAQKHVHDFIILRELKRQQILKQRLAYRSHY